MRPIDTNFDHHILQSPYDDPGAVQATRHAEQEQYRRDRADQRVNAMLKACCKDKALQYGTIFDFGAAFFTGGYSDLDISVSGLDIDYAAEDFVGSLKEFVRRCEVWLKEHPRGK